MNLQFRYMYRMEASCSTITEFKGLNKLNKITTWKPAFYFDNNDYN